MRKFLAILTVISWSGFWAFGYLALASRDYTTGELLTAVLIAGVGFLVGSWAYLRLAREDER